MAAEYKDYYAILGVPRNAGKEEISKAYKKMARKHHPDLNHGDPRAEERLKEINEAYEVLKDPKKRQLYDQLGPDWQNAQQFGGGPGNFHFDFGGQDLGGFSDFFKTIFGGQGASFGGRSPFGSAGPFGGAGFDGSFGQYGRSRRGEDQEYVLQITLEESVRGGEKTVAVGTGDSRRSLKVNIPAGIRDNGRLRLSGQGGHGTPPGDLYLTVKYLPHPVFKVTDSDISADVHIKPWEAVFGTKATVPTLDGKVELTVPPGTGSGKKLRLRGKGLGPAGKRGDEYAVIQISVPKPSELSPDEQKLWKALAGQTADLDA